MTTPLTSRSNGSLMNSHVKTKRRLTDDEVADSDRPRVVAELRVLEGEMKRRGMTFEELCETCDGVGKGMTMVPTPSGPVEAMVHCWDCGPEDRRGMRAEW